MKNDFSLSMVAADNLELGLFRYCLIPQEGFLAVNPALWQMFGYRYYRSDFFQEKFVNLFVNSKDKDVFFEMLSRNGNVKFFEALFRKKDGETVWVAITASSIFTNGNAKCIEGIIQNISSYKNRQKKLLMEKKFFKDLLDNIPDAIYFKDRNNRITKVNKFYIKGTGLREEEIIGKTDFDFFPYEQAKKMFDDDNYVLDTGNSIIGKIEKTRLPNGSLNQVITTKIPTFNTQGRIVGIMGITRDMTVYADLEKERFNMMVNTLEVLGKALQMRDPYTFTHTRNVACIAEEIAKVLAWNKDRLLGIKLAGELHDLGKISIPLDILNKPGELSKLEYSLIQEHSKNCYNLIGNFKFPFPLAEIIYQHHERLDGSGYPRKLKGEDILLEARILAVSDVLEAMTHHRPYREALGLSRACKELKKDRGRKYDAEIVDIALGLVTKNKEKEFWLDN